MDAEGKAAGRVAAQVAALLRGKHKTNFTPNVDCGDFVIVINADKVVLSGNKGQENIYWHTLYPGGLKSRTREEFKEKMPARALERTIKGMLPHNKLGAEMFRKLKVYAGAEHRHEAQQPEKIEIS